VARVTDAVVPAASAKVSTKRRVPCACASARDDACAQSGLWSAKTPPGLPTPVQGPRVFNPVTNVSILTVDLPFDPLWALACAEPPANVRAPRRGHQAAWRLLPEGWEGHLELEQKYAWRVFFATLPCKIRKEMEQGAVAIATS